jgi:hypothetical protein
LLLAWGLVQEELQAAGQQQQRPPPVLKFRAAGSKEWRHPCVLLPGLHLAAAAGKGGNGTTAPAAEAEVEVGAVQISKCCATTCILLLPSPGVAIAAAAAGEAGEAEAASVAAVAAVAAEQPRPLRVEVRCRQLQVALWDDERQRLLPAAKGYGSGGGSRALGRELFSFTVDHLHLQLSRQLHLAAALAAGGAHSSRSMAQQLHPWQQQVLLVMAAQLTAAALQLDSFLPGGEQPVLLTTLPEDGIGSGGGHYRQRRGPPLQLSLEVHHCPPPLPASSSSSGDASSGEMSFRNSWVKELLVQLPTLAVAADDSLLLFGDRLMGLMAGGGGDSTGSYSNTALAVAGSRVAAGQQQAALALLQQSLAAEAAGAAASRLYTEQAVVESGGCRCLNPGRAAAHVLTW